MASQMGINFFLYFAMVFTGFIGAYLEIRYKRHYKIHFALFSLFFYFAVISRIGHAYDYSDFQHYLDYFMSDNDAYFQSGYVLITELVKEHLGYSPVYLVSTLFVLVVTAACFVGRELHRQLCLNEGYPIKSCNYLFTFLSVWSVYYGFTYCAEGLRPGFALAILYISMVFALNRKWISSILFLLASTYFHTQAVIFIPGIILLFVVNTVSLKTLRIWFAVNLILGLLIGLFRIFDFTLLELIFNAMDSQGDASHYEGYLSAKETSFISTQWFTKQLVGFLLLQGNHSNKLYNRATALYYTGMSIAAIMSASTIFLRFEAIYTPAFLFAFYYYLRDNNYAKDRRILLLAFFLTYFGIMLVRFLGFYF